LEEREDVTISITSAGKPLFDYLLLIVRNYFTF